MSDDYDARLAAWCVRHNLRNPDTGEHPAGIFLKPDSELDDEFTEEIMGSRLFLRDCDGTIISVSLAEAKRLRNEVGQFASWDHFDRLEALRSYRAEDISDEENP